MPLASCSAEFGDPLLTVSGTVSSSSLFDRNTQYSRDHDNPLVTYSGIGCSLTSSVTIRDTTKPEPTKKLYVTENCPDLPTIHFTPGPHSLIILDQKSNCFFCRFRATVFDHDRKTQTVIACEIYNIALCMSKARNCFREFHKS